MDIIYSQKFSKEYKKIPDNIKKLAEDKEVLFRKNPFDLKLKTHRLRGKLKIFYSFSIDYKYRIIFEFSKDKKKVYFHLIGKHDIYN